MLKSELKQCIIDNGLGNLLLVEDSYIYIEDSNNVYLVAEDKGVYIAYDISDDYTVLDKFNNKFICWEPSMFVPFENEDEIHRRIKKIAVRLKEINIKEKLKNINDDFVEI